MKKGNISFTMEYMLSVCLAVYNEEKNLPRCLESVKNIADEIVIVDGGSTDKTVEIAKSFHAKLIQTDNPPIFHINKQKALDACSNEWILQLDADEVVSPTLAHQIQMIVSGEPLPLLTDKQQKLFSRHQQQIEQRDGSSQQINGDVSAYYIPRLNYFLGGFLRHGGVYPDGVIRLVKKGRAHFPCKSVHEQIQVDGVVRWVPEPLLHYGDPTFSRYLVRADRYTSLTATEFKKNRVKKNAISFLKYVMLLPFQTWFLLFFRHKGFLDGFPGFVFAVFSGIHYAIAYFKYLEQKS